VLIDDTTDQVFVETAKGRTIRLLLLLRMKICIDKKAFRAIKKR